MQEKAPYLTQAKAPHENKHSIPGFSSYYKLMSSPKSWEVRVNHLDLKQELYVLLFFQV